MRLPKYGMSDHVVVIDNINVYPFHDFSLDDVIYEIMGYMFKEDDDSWIYFLQGYDYDTYEWFIDYVYEDEIILA